MRGKIGGKACQAHIKASVHAGELKHLKLLQLRGSATYCATCVFENIYHKPSFIAYTIRSNTAYHPKSFRQLSQTARQYARGSSPPWLQYTPHPHSPLTSTTSVISAPRGNCSSSLIPSSGTRVHSACMRSSDLLPPAALRIELEGLGRGSALPSAGYGGILAKGSARMSCGTPRTDEEASEGGTKTHVVRARGCVQWRPRKTQVSQ